LPGPAHQSKKASSVRASLSASRQQSTPKKGKKDKDERQTAKN